MTASEFAAKDWGKRLAQALAALAKTHDLYWDELYLQRQQRVRTEREIFHGSPFDHPSQDLMAFYSHACFGQGHYFAEHYRSVRTALAEVRVVLAAHPALTSLVDPSDGRDELWIQIVNHGGIVNLLSVIGGLMARGMEMPEDGFRLAASEFNALVEPAGNLDRALNFDDLLVGYHVALFHGLRVSERVPLANDMAIMPFEQLGAFVNKSVLQDVAPSVIKYNGWNSIGAIVKSFCWKPEIHKRGDDANPDLDWGGSFFHDAEAFVELLAMSHAAPVVCLVTVPYCIHRVASSLLGRPHHHGGYGWGRSARSFDSHAGVSDLSLEALDESRKAFENRQSSRYQECAPVIARLAEALARSGRFRTDDKILDVAIALERMYELQGGEISFGISP